jgi:hypothetical protein
MGGIEWSTESHEFIFFPGDRRCFSARCLKEIVAFMKPLNRERKEGIKRLRKMEQERKKGEATG